MSDRPAEKTRELDPAVLLAAARRKLRIREAGGGTLTIPAVPSLTERYLKKLLTAFDVLDRPFSEPEAQVLRAQLRQLIEAAWAQSPYSRLMVRYQTDARPGGGISYQIDSLIVPVAHEYDRWVKERPQPFFGSAPNAKVLHLARSLGEPSTVAILDVGAADGRNTLPLAREGFVTDAVELSPEFAKILGKNLEAAGLGANIYVGDVLDPGLPLPKGYYGLVVMAGLVVAHFRDPKHLRRLLERVSELLAPGGLVLFSIFLALDGFEPEPQLRELAELFWTVVFTPAELEGVLEGLPLELVDDASYVEYERQHMPESWPPTDFFEAYCAGQDLFDLPADRPPLEMRWRTYRKR
ncbi:MAG TPA: class I SAM-dependent methyltransferase [Polyangiaceae bacterium]